MTTSEPIRILCVEDHRIVREGIRLLLEREADLAVVAVAEPASRPCRSTERIVRT